MTDSEPDDLREVMAAYFSDNTVPDGVEELLFAGSTDRLYHQRVVRALAWGLSAVHAGDREVLSLLRREVGPFVGEPAAAADFLQEILDRYTEGAAAQGAGTEEGRE